MTGAKLLLLGLILVLGTFAVIGPISAQPVISISNTGNIEVIAGQSNHNSIQFSVPEGLEVNSVTISCSCLPSGATCSTNPPSLPGPFSNGDSFEVVINTSPSTPPGTYPITVEVFFTIPLQSVSVIQPSFLISSGGSLGPESVSIQQTASASTHFTLIVDPAPAPPAIPEYPLGLPILAIFMLVSYGLIRRRTSAKEF